MKNFTDFKTAVKWGDCQLILCNEIPHIDEDIWDSPIFWDEETDSANEVYQWYITDLSEWQKKWQEETFNLHYVYSQVLGCYVLPVFHCGTSWDSVPCEVLSEDWANLHPNLLIKK